MVRVRTLPSAWGDLVVAKSNPIARKLFAERIRKRRLPLRDSGWEAPKRAMDSGRSAVVTEPARMRRLPKLRDRLIFMCNVHPMKVKKKQGEDCKVTNTITDLVDRGLFGFLWVFSGVFGRGIANSCSSCAS